MYIYICIRWMLWNILHQAGNKTPNLGEFQDLIRPSKDFQCHDFGTISGSTQTLRWSHLNIQLISNHLRRWRGGGGGRGRRFLSKSPGWHSKPHHLRCCYISRCHLDTQLCGVCKPRVPFPVCGFSMSTGAVCEKKCVANTFIKNGDTTTFCNCHQGTSKIRTPWGPQCFLKTWHVIWLDTSTWSQSPRIGNCGMWTSLPIPNARIFWYWMSGNLILLIPREKHQL